MTVLLTEPLSGLLLAPLSVCGQKGTASEHKVARLTRCNFKLGCQDKIHPGTRAHQQSRIDRMHRFVLTGRLPSCIQPCHILLTLAVCNPSADGGWPEETGFLKDSDLVDEATVFMSGTRPAISKSSPVQMQNQRVGTCVKAKRSRARKSIFSPMMSGCLMGFGSLDVGLPMSVEIYV